jgi:hypothetical protein
MKTKEEIESRLEMKKLEREAQLRNAEKNEDDYVNVMFQSITLSQIRVLEWVLRDWKED